MPLAAWHGVRHPLLRRIRGAGLSLVYGLALAGAGIAVSPQGAAAQSGGQITERPARSPTKSRWVRPDPRKTR